MKVEEQAKHETESEQRFLDLFYTGNECGMPPKLQLAFS
jgi:hypothetical protein